MSAPAYLSMNGRLVPYAEARVHVLAPAITYGATVFEGIRGYWSKHYDDCLLFRLDEHLERLAFSMKVMRFQSDLEPRTIRAWIRELVRANGQKDEVHIRALAYVSEGPNMFTTAPVEVAIASLARPGRNIGQGGVRATISNWRRISDDAMPPRVKCASNYQNGRLASLQAKHDGYDTPILLSSSGHVAEAPGSCVFLRRGDRLVTPGVTSDILESITRDSVIEIARQRCRVPVEERDVDRSELYMADEVFLCGTASEIVPVSEIDGFRVGDGGVGELTREIATLYGRLVRGELGYPEWFAPVYRDSLGVPA
ncbi:MAG: branched-chain-amino-acid transaminase [Alphaproteobacteria bacterium]|nr:branched-chain-amino-acid transaminase [Alphaproteobacteria bacterium]